jgi:hypothetical protein
LSPLNIDSFQEKVPEYKKEIPPYNGFGSEEDSLRSWKHLVLNSPVLNIPKPYKKDFIKSTENEHRVLRFAAVLDSPNMDYKDREFIICFRLSDDMMKI